MGKHLLTFVFLVISTQAFSQGKTEAEMIFRDTIHNFGTIWYKNEAIYEFTFKNTGKSPLIINKVQSSCGCTVPEWGKEPVLPKRKAVIKVAYDSNKIGAFQKTIKIYSNARNSPVTLLIIGEIKVTD